MSAPFVELMRGLAGDAGLRLLQVEAHAVEAVEAAGAGAAAEPHLVDAQPRGHQHGGPLQLGLLERRAVVRHCTRFAAKQAQGHEKMVSWAVG